MTKEKAQKLKDLTDEKIADLNYFLKQLNFKNSEIYHIDEILEKAVNSIDDLISNLELGKEVINSEIDE